MTNVLDDLSASPSGVWVKAPLSPNGHGAPNPGHEVVAGTRNAERSITVTKPKRRITLGGVLLIVASVFLLGLAATQGFVSWHQQFVFINAAKHDHLVSALEAIGLDAGAVIFAILALALALLGRSARIERVLNISCAMGSMLMNILGADLGSPRSVAVYVLPPVLYAAGSDRLIAVVRRQALATTDDREAQRSAWRMVGTGALYLMRFVLAPPSTAVGMRRWVLGATPLPVISAPGEGKPAVIVLPPKRAISAAGKKAAKPRGDSKTSRFIALVISRRGPLETLPAGDVSRICAELAPEVGLDAGAARTALRARVLAAQDGGAA